MVTIALYELQLNHQLCDATIRLEDGGTYPVHRPVLSACSMFFKALFTSTLHIPDQQHVHLAMISSSTMVMILEYAYLRNTEINDDNVCILLMTADYLAMLGLLNKCSGYIQNRLSPQNCLGVMRFAKDNFCEHLAEASHRYLMRHFVNVTNSSQEILKCNLNELLALIRADELNVRSEEVVWECILRWIGYAPEDRKRHMVPLMKSIRLGLLDTQFFLEHVKDHLWVVSNEDCRPIVIETLKFLYDLEMITQRDGEVPTPEIARPRVPHEVMFAIGGWSGGSPTSFIETYDTRADRWVRVEEVDPQGPRAYHGTAVIDFDIYVVGGFDGMDYFNSCRRFNAVDKTWREIAPMNARRCYVSVAVLKRKVYAMGGYDGHHRQNTAERYDRKTNQWTLISPMNVQRSDASATTLNDRVYIAGGFNGQECMNTAEYYNPDSNQWTMIANMRYRRSGVSCIAYHGFVYVIGGFNGISRMCSGEKYNPEVDTWIPIPDMYNPRSNFAVEVIDDMIFSVGGFNGVTTIYHVECYDERTDEWYEATDMNVYRSALSASVIMGLPNVSDYIHQHRERLMEEKRLKLLALEQRHDPEPDIINHGNNNHDMIHGIEVDFDDPDEN